MIKNKTVTIEISKGIVIEVYDVEIDEIMLLEGEARNVFRIDYCTQGILEGEFENRTFSYIGEKETVINYERLALSKTFFPVRIYKGISILFFLDEIDSDFKNLSALFRIDIAKMCHTFHLKDGWYKLTAQSEIAYMMEQFYLRNVFDDLVYFKIKILEILHLLNRTRVFAYCKEEYYAGYYIHKVKKIHNIAIKNIASPVSFQNLVKNEALSYTVFQKLFKHMYGDSPYAYLKKYKLKMAAFYISSTDKTISEIALDCGYTNVSKFAQAFKALYGRTPLQYRKKG